MNKVKLAIYRFSISIILCFVDDDCVLYIFQGTLKRQFSYSIFEFNFLLFKLLNLVLQNPCFSKNLASSEVTINREFLYESRSLFLVFKNQNSFKRRNLKK